MHHLKRKRQKKKKTLKIKEKKNNQKYMLWILYFLRTRNAF